MGSDDKDRPQETTFKVTDRRLFTPEGELRPEAQRTASEGEPQEEKRAQPPRSEAPAQGKKGGEEARGQAMDFSSFVVSLATTGMMHLGEMPDPVTGRKVENLDAARQMIEILGILQQKTKGNLSAEEDRLLDEILYELRMHYLTKAKVISL